MNIYRINEVAQKLGISKQTLKRYEKKGIFPHSHRNRINHWREYTEEDVQRMARIIGRSSPGFALIEIVIVIIIVGILAVVAMPRITVFNTVKIDSVTKKISFDIAYMQRLASATHDAYRMSFDVALDKYEIRRSSDNAFAKDPLTGNDFIVDLRNDPVIGGTDIISASFDGTPGFQFDWQSIPQNINGVNLTSEGSVRVSYRGSGSAVYVRPQTGSVRVE